MELDKIKSLIDNVVFLDIETSGVDPFKSDILEIGAIKVKNSQIEIFNTLIKNNKEIPIEILSLCSGMNKEDFDLAPNLNDIKIKFIDF